MYTTDGKDFPKSYEMVLNWSWPSQRAVQKKKTINDSSFFYPPQTLGVELATKVVYIPDTNDAVELQLCDSSGQSFYADNIGKYVSLILQGLSFYRWTSLSKQRRNRYG